MDIESLLERMQPPKIPDAALDQSNSALYALTGWRQRIAASILAGLSTEPAFYANGIRIDWLQRLVLSKSTGRKKPSGRDFNRALNEGLEAAGVLRLEDPLEDIFCDIVSGARGSFRIFAGQWEMPGPYTETLLTAFESLPDAARKRDALDAVYALLRVSEALAERSGVERLTAAGGAPMGILEVPRSGELERLARRVKFTASELNEIGVDRDALVPFILPRELFHFVSDGEPGDTPLEFHPLLEVSGGIIVLSPANISIAVRSVLVNAAVQGGMEPSLLEAMMIEQQTYSEHSGFWPVPHLQRSGPNAHGMRAGVCQCGEGRYLHIVQVPARFEGFPAGGFCAVRSLGTEAEQFIAEDVQRFWDLVAARGDCRQCVTVLLLSGWGAPHSVAPPIDESAAPQSWQFFGLSFADAAVLGACEGGKFRDICRLLTQLDRMEDQGFSFMNVNGILNLFGHWQATDGNLISEGHHDIVPPCQIMISTDYLLGPRQEAARKRDLRSLALGDGSRKLVQRIDWDEDGGLLPIYASMEDVAEGVLLGAVRLNGRVWWVRSEAQPGETREWRYRIWTAVLHWLLAVGEKICAASPNSFPPGSYAVDIDIPEENAFNRIDRTRFEGTDVGDTILVQRHPARIAIATGWIEQLWTVENAAEVELVAGICEAISSEDAALTRVPLRTAVRNAIGSPDWRWLHAHPVRTALDRLGATHLVRQFRQVPTSALSLAKCCSVWAFHDRSHGLEIAGEKACGEFLARYRDHVLDDLIKNIRQFDRTALTAAAASCYQAARIEQSRWRNTIRALRAIGGTDADARAIKRQYAINAVQRTAKGVCEIAGCEAAMADGIAPDRTDLDELFATTLLLMGNGDLFASIRAGLIEPQIRISPAGDLLSERSVFETTLRPGAEWTYGRAFHEAAQAYARPREHTEPNDASERLPWDDELRSAVEAEYGGSAAAFFDLQFAVIQMAESRGTDVFTIRRSELCAALKENPDYLEADVLRLCERLTLRSRKSWDDLPDGILASAFDLARFDRPHSLINRPLLALDNEPDPLILVVPLFISDSAMYSVSGLIGGSLQGEYWSSLEAVSLSGAQAHRSGEAFEVRIADRLRQLGLEAWPHCTLSWALNQKVDETLGNIDVLALGPDRQRVWVIEAKNLKLCRTGAEVASRLTEYRGRTTINKRGREKPDKMLKHLRRVRYLREHSAALCGRLKLDEAPEVRGLLIVDSPQPMNFHMLDDVPDAESAFLDAIDAFEF